tara:strand:+ start:4493 stop:4843 length:351 start_codon:yes stop_codon:yes gene_type:complete
MIQWLKDKWKIFNNVSIKNNEFVIHSKKFQIEVEVSDNALILLSTLTQAGVKIDINLFDYVFKTGSKAEKILTIPERLQALKIKLGAAEKAEQFEDAITIRDEMERWLKKLKTNDE